MMCTKCYADLKAGMQVASHCVALQVGSVVAALVICGFLCDGDHSGMKMMMLWTQEGQGGSNNQTRLQWLPMAASKLRLIFCIAMKWTLKLKQFPSTHSLVKSVPKYFIARVISQLLPVSPGNYLLVPGKILRFLNPYPARSSTINLRACCQETFPLLAAVPHIHNGADTVVTRCWVYLWIRRHSKISFRDDYH